MSGTKIHVFLKNSQESYIEIIYFIPFLRMETGIRILNTYDYSYVAYLISNYTVSH
jgi:hypothetical protein